MTCRKIANDARPRRKHSARRRDLHRLVRNRPEGSHRGLHRFSKRRRAQTVLHHRADRRSRITIPIYRAAHVTLPALDPGAAWMTSELDGGSADQRNGGERAVVRLQTSGRGQNGNDERLQGRVVCRLHQRDDLRRLGRVRSTDNDHSARLRRGPRPAGLDAGDEQSGSALSGERVSTDSATAARHRLLDLKRDRDRRLQSPPEPPTKSICRSTEFRAGVARYMAERNC